MSFINFQVPYKVDERYSKKVAYFSMEFGIHQPLKGCRLVYAMTTK